MKKLVLMFAAIAAISFASCDQKAKQETPMADSTAMNDSAMTDSVQTPADSTQNDSVK
ncbi:entericidin [Prevotella sp. OH937_COT-195]|uniref:PG1828 family lipoprotein n=1 Tax=Prevotella sp. OH937_COT-195 TaxID=2491051 RepID=UPI000F64E0EE|nr:entericidin [Prevotella sp. OH937_COT-195]RRD02022.1 entericidin [Prevotella sp. OH937_COT-195]